MLEGYNAKQTEAIIKNILKYHKDFDIIKEGFSFSTNSPIKNLINKIQDDKYVCIRKLKKEEKDIIINILKKIVNDRLKSYELEKLGIQPKYI